MRAIVEFRQILAWQHKQAFRRGMTGMGQPGSVTRDSLTSLRDAQGCWKGYNVEIELAAKLQKKLEVLLSASLMDDQSMDKIR